MCDSSQILGATFIGFTIGWGANMLVHFFRSEQQFQAGVIHAERMQALHFMSLVEKTKAKAKLETDDISEFRGEPVTYQMKLAIRWAAIWYLDKLRADTKKAYKVFFE